jgi:hypothetical protein
VQRLTTEQLKQIALDCESLEEVQYQISQQSYEELISSCRSIILRNLNGKSHALIKAIPGVVIPVDMVPYTTGYNLEFALLGAAALPIFIITLSAGLCLGSYLFYNAYKKKKAEQAEIIHFFQLGNFKLQAFDELINREENQIREITQEFHSSRKRSFAENQAWFFHPSKDQASYTKALGAGLITTVTLSYTAWNAASFFQTLGYVTISASLATPLGLAIVLGVTAIAIGIGAYLGYKHYQSQKSQLVVKHKKAEIFHNLKQKKQIYGRLFEQKQKIEMRKDIDDIVQSRLVEYSQISRSHRL